MLDNTYIDGYNGAIDGGIDPRDYTAQDLYDLVEKLPNNPHKYSSQVNQGKNKSTKYGCTVVGAMIDCGFNTGVPVRDGLGVKYSNACIEGGTLDIKKGGNSATNSKEVAKLWNNEFKENYVVYGTLYYANSLVKKIVDKGYIIGISIGLTANWYKSLMDKKISQSENTKGKELRGHRPAGIYKENGKYYLLDNYSGTEHNIVEFENWETVLKQFKNGPFRSFCYPLLPINTKKEGLELKNKAMLNKKRALIPDSMSVAYSDVDSPTQEALHNLADTFRKKYNIKRIKEPIYRLVANSLSVIYSRLPDELKEPAHKIAEFCRSKY